MKKYKILFPLFGFVLTGLNGCGSGIKPNIQSSCNHSYFISSDNQYHYKQCNQCGKIDSSTKAAHTYITSDSNPNVKVCSVCGRKKGGAVSEHSHVYDDNKYYYDPDGHYQRCIICDAPSEKVQHTFVKDMDAVSDNKDATCTEGGYEWQICSVCKKRQQKNIAALGHDYSQIISTTATCTYGGEASVCCKRCGVVSGRIVSQEALGHDMQDDPTYTGLDATCTSTGTKRQKCVREGCDYTEIVDVPALGHGFQTIQVQKNDEYKADIKVQACVTCSRARFTWTADDVTYNCKYLNRMNENSEIEPNYIIQNDGPDGDGGEFYARFWGRPLHNGIKLDVNGRIIEGDNNSSVYNSEIDGSYLEYTINLTQSFSKLRLAADMIPSANLGSGDLYEVSNRDRTPGFKDSINNKSPYRYAIFVDGTELTFDFSNHTSPGPVRDWYTFPTNGFGLNAGEHTIKIVMTGGDCGIFYKFGLLDESYNPHGQHNFIKDITLSQDPTCTTSGHFYGICSCGLVDSHYVPALGHDWQNKESSQNFAGNHYTEGAQYQECANCGESRIVVIPIQEHELIFDGNISRSGCATVQKYFCGNDSYRRYVIDAKEVTDNTNNNERYNGEFSEPNYVNSEDGSVRFWGRPAHNSRELNENGNAIDALTNPSSYFDSTITGSFIEYKFYTPSMLNYLSLLFDLKPASYMSGGMFANYSGDWIPGIMDAQGTLYDTRYIIYLDGIKLEQDLTNDQTAGSKRKWFKVPLVDMINLPAGEHTLKIVMGGGYLCSFYNIGFESL